MLELVLQIQKQSDEFNLLIEHYKTARSRLIRERAHCVLLAMQGRHVPDIADILLRDKDTVRTWLKAYQEDKLASIFPNYNGNTNASKLTTEQLTEIKTTLQAAPNSAGGLPGAFWSVKKLRSYVEAVYDVVYESDRSYHHLFAVSNFSFKLPEGFDLRRDDDLVAKRMTALYQEIEQKAAEDYVVFFADECSLAWETEYRRVWLPKGKKTVLRVNRKKVRQHYFGALNMATNQEELIRLDWQNAKTITGALRELTSRYAGKKLCLVWDNATHHRAKELRDLLGKGNEFEHVHLIWLPPYAPDYNPQEHVWRVAKQATKNAVTNTFEGLKQVFEQAISGQRFDYKLSRAVS